MTGARLAQKLFPDVGNVIHDLFSRDGNFRDMCEELADLESAISSIDELPWVRRGDLLVDWLAARERLTREMAQAIAEAKVIRIGRGHRGPRC